MEKFKRIFLVLSFLCLGVDLLIYLYGFIVKDGGIIVFGGVFTNIMGGIFLVISKSQKFALLSYVFLFLAVFSLFPLANF